MGLEQLDQLGEVRQRPRQAVYLVDDGGLPFLGSYGDLLFEKAANDTIAEFARRKIRSVVKDPACRELLTTDNAPRPCRRKSG